MNHLPFSFKNANGKRNKIPGQCRFPNLRKALNQLLIPFLPILDRWSIDVSDAFFTAPFCVFHRLFSELAQL